MYLEYFETTADDFMEDCNWDKPLKEKMRHPVAAKGQYSLDSDQARTMTDIAWFDDPHRPVEVPLWDEPAKEKMRRPVRTNGHPVNDEILKKLIAFSSLY